MDYWTDPSVWREHRRELLREAQQRQLDREVRKARQTIAHSNGGFGTVELRADRERHPARGWRRWIRLTGAFVAALLPSRNTHAREAAVHRTCDPAKGSQGAGNVTTADDGASS